jgi:uncharacterized cupin superfamily protein
VQGTGKVRIGKEEWDLQPGTIVKVPAGKAHGFTNTGAEDLVFLVIYDPRTWLARSSSSRPVLAHGRRRQAVREHSRTADAAVGVEKIARSAPMAGEMGGSCVLSTTCSSLAAGPPG